MGHARSLLALDSQAQQQAAREVVAKGLSVRQTEDLVRRSQQPKTEKAKPTADADVLRLQEQLSDRLGTKVAIRQNAKGKGQVSIAYASLDQLDGILLRLDPDHDQY